MWSWEYLLRQPAHTCPKTQHQCDGEPTSWTHTHVPQPTSAKERTSDVGNEISKSNQSWPISREMAVRRAWWRRQRSSGWSSELFQLGLRWPDGGDGRKWEGAKAVWLTWAFVGRWWEAPPWPPSQNAKQRCYCVSSTATDACAARFSGNQKHSTKKK